MNGEGFAFFWWRVMNNPGIGDDESWWAFWLPYDLGLWQSGLGKGANDGR